MSKMADTHGAVGRKTDRDPDSQRCGHNIQAAVVPHRRKRTSPEAAAPGDAFFIYASIFAAARAGVERPMWVRVSSSAVPSKWA